MYSKGMGGFVVKPFRKPILGYCNEHILITELVNELCVCVCVSCATTTERTHLRNLGFHAN